MSRAWFFPNSEMTPNVLPTIRVALADYVWCDLNSNNHNDVEKFKSIVFGKHRNYVVLRNKFIKIAFTILRDKKPYSSHTLGFKIHQEVNKKLKYNCFYTR